MNTILVINTGSSSIKFAIFEIQDTTIQTPSLYRGVIRDIGKEARFQVQQNHLLTFIDEQVEAANHEMAIQILLNYLTYQLPDKYNIIAVGYRVVHGGVNFYQSVKLNSTVLNQLKALIPLAPLHQSHALLVIEKMIFLKPQLLHVASFDTAFHQDIPKIEQIFALPRTLTEQGIRRYGFHGLSYEYISQVLSQYLNKSADEKIVVAHLGQGASLCAMYRGKSVATSMSFTPLDGLPMATRCGSIDPAVVLYLIREKQMTESEISELLHYQSGLLGLSGISGDIRDLLASTSPKAEESVEFFINQLHKEIASHAAALGGLDSLVFTGGIGENISEVRTMLCQSAAWLGIKINENANQLSEKCISTEDSQVSVWVIPTDEEQVIAGHTTALLTMHEKDH